MGDRLSLISNGDFLINRGREIGPKKIFEAGRIWFRFMDRIYTPLPLFELSKSQVEELCSLRLELNQQVIDQEIHSHVAGQLVSLAWLGNAVHQPRVLDFGTGDGRAVPMLTEKFGRNVIGCDCSRFALSHGSSQPRILVAAEGPLPFEAGAVDLIFCLFVMHFDIGQRARSELARSCAADGCLVANVYGDAIGRHRALMRLAGWRLEIKENVHGLPGHELELWKPQNLQVRPDTRALNTVKNKILL